MMHFARDGSPIDLMQWAVLCGDKKMKRVREDTVISSRGGTFWVSTVWLGLDYSFGEGPPLIFETMVFTTDSSDGDTDFGGGIMHSRYATENQAVQGHIECVAQVKAGTFNMEED